MAELGMPIISAGMGPWMKEATSTHHFNQVSTKSSKA
jgi:hypothetical protein